VFKQITPLLQLRGAAKAQHEPAGGGRGAGLLIGDGKAGRIHGNEGGQIIHCQERHPDGLRVASRDDLERCADFGGELGTAQVVERRRVVLPAIGSGRRRAGELAGLFVAADRAF
jgi:hypothetical protein